MLELVVSDDSGLGPIPLTLRNGPLRSRSGVDVACVASACRLEAVRLLRVRSAGHALVRTATGDFRRHTSCLGAPGRRRCGAPRSRLTSLASGLSCFDLRRAVRILEEETPDPAQGRADLRQRRPIGANAAPPDRRREVASPGSRLARVLGVTTAGYHAWQKRPVSDRRKDDELLGKLIQTAHAGSHGIYVAPRIYVELELAHGERVSRKRIARLMGELGLEGVSRRGKRRTDDR